MELNQIEVTYHSPARSITARAGDTLLDAALDHGIDLPHECGGNCACTTCQVEVMEGVSALSPMEEVERERLETADERAPHARLACQAILRGGPVVVCIVENRR